MKTFKPIIFVIIIFSIFNVLSVVAEATPLKAPAKVTKIYPPFLIFDEGGEIAICTTREGIKDGMRFGTKHGSYEVRGDSIWGPNGLYNIISLYISSPSGKRYNWNEDSVGEYKIWSNEIKGPTGIYFINLIGVISPITINNDCVAR